jgi:formylglycine-generating enzyme required for sulfatase activity
MIRGGAYSSREPAVHSAYRSGAHYKAVYNLIGFRLAKDLPV